ncbi:MAG: sigma-70 family RNA polymerase sigma factor [Bacteriovoracaceae bacterium]|nr:sigma-70 family RNA polymerase sigma factor [Bacteroidota bacterium]
MKPTLFFLNNDAKILDLMHQGDDEALVMLFRQNQKAVSSYVLRNNGSQDDAEDVLQESVIILWERVKRGRFEYSAKLSTFIFAVAKNVWSRKRMRKYREPATEFENSALDSGEQSALDSLIDSERSRLIASALEKLGDPCRMLLVLYYWEERSQEEIALQMGFANAATVKSKKYTCMKMLENILCETGIKQ